MQVPMKYMDKLLEDWRAGGVRTVEEAAARHDAARQARAASSPAQTPATNPALNYAQREYKEEDYGDDFFVDLDKYGDDTTGGGDGK
jgi:DNA replication protein DnaD